MPSLRKAEVQSFGLWSPGTGSQSSRLHPLSQLIDVASYDGSLFGAVQLGLWLCAVWISVAELCCVECSSECSECSVNSLRKKEADKEW